MTLSRATALMNVSVNHLRILLKCKFGFSRSEVGPTFCISDEFPGEVGTAGPQAKLSGTLSGEGLDLDCALQPHLTPGLPLTSLPNLKRSFVSWEHILWPASRDGSFLPSHTQGFSPASAQVSTRQTGLRHPACFTGFFPSLHDLQAFFTS